MAVIAYVVSFMKKAKNRNKQNIPCIHRNSSFCRKSCKPAEFIENKYILASHSTQFSSAKRHSHVLVSLHPVKLGMGIPFTEHMVQMWNFVNGSSHQTFYLAELRSAHRRYCRDCIRSIFKTSICIESQNGTKLFLCLPNRRVT